ncbi:MAG: transposase, partial [Planctomycetaceae bacterium]|nr:transposase [Planctomycetaceae bacterium]
MATFAIIHHEGTKNTKEIKRLVRHGFADAKKVTIILDNLNTHTKGSLDTRFPPAYCREILRRCEFVYTPGHGSWLNFAESELSVLTKQCLCGRIGSIDEVRKQAAVWTAWRNDHAKS